jgi:hypothetical protein
MQWRMQMVCTVEGNANNHAAHAEIGSQMDREKRNPRLDGVSALLVCVLPCEAPSAVTCVGLCCLSSNLEVFHSIFLCVFGWGF